MRRMIDGAGYFLNDNRLSGGIKDEGDAVGCMHCHAGIHVRDVTKPKIGVALRAYCYPCDGHLCPECGFETYLHGHNNPDYERTWPHHKWVQHSLNEVHRRKQNASILGV